MQSAGRDAALSSRMDEGEDTAYAEDEPTVELESTGEGEGEDPVNAEGHDADQAEDNGDQGQVITGVEVEGEDVHEDEDERGGEAEDVLSAERPADEQEDTSHAATAMSEWDQMYHLANTMDMPTFIDHLPKEPIIGHFELMEVLGDGSHGRVYKARHRATGSLFAVKEVALRADAPPRNVNHLHQEIYYHSLCRHEHIATLYKVYIHETPATRVYYFVMELLEGGELFYRLKNASRFTEADASRVVKALASALDYLHSRGIAHRDLKPENIMLKYKDCEPWDLKIIDFGYARTGPMTTPLGSGFYISPEILQAYQSRLAYRFIPGRPVPFTYHTQTDMWTLGVITFVLLTGRPPFRRGKQRWWEDPTLRANILSRKYEFKPTEAVSREAQDLVSCLLRVNPQERFTAQEVLSHPWIIGSPEFALRDLSSPRILRGDEAAHVFQQVKEEIEQAREQAHQLQTTATVPKGFGRRAEAKLKSRRQHREDGSKRTKDQEP
eukprot:m.46652 g.46652  ORF g.46652 m.46652 type:complete len:497 (+) comp12264_c2_seq1:61-1551(+)